MASWRMGFSMGWKVERNVICCNDDFSLVKHVIADSFVFSTCYYCWYYFGYAVILLVVSEYLYLIILLNLSVVSTS